MKYFISISLFLKAMSKGKIAAAAFVPLLLVESVFIAPGNALNAKDLYQLCSSFPLNSPGREMRSQLEKITGLQAEVPQAKAQ